MQTWVRLLPSQWIFFQVESYLLTYAHRSQWSIGHQRPPPPSPPATPPPAPSHTVLGCSCHSGPVGPLLFQLCFSVSPPAVKRPASLPFPLWVPGQGLACGAGCWLPEGVSDPAPLPPQYLLGHWFLSRSLPQIFISERSSHTSDLKIGTPLATQLGTWHHRISAWTGWPGVSIL